MQSAKVDRAYSSNAPSLRFVCVLHEKLSIGKHVGSEIRAHAGHGGHVILAVATIHLRRLIHELRRHLAVHLEVHVVHGGGECDGGERSFC